MLEQKNTKQDEQNMTYLSSRSQEDYKDSINNLIEEVHSLKLSVEKWINQKEISKMRLEDTLWTVEDVALYLHKSKGTIQSHYQNKQGFPRAKKIGSKRYWKPKEVIAYAQRKPEY